jgi:hypothetical protein
LEGASTENSSRELKIDNNSKRCRSVPEHNSQQALFIPTVSPMKTRRSQRQLKLSSIHCLEMTGIRRNRKKLLRFSELEKEIKLPTVRKSHRHILQKETNISINNTVSASATANDAANRKSAVVGSKSETNKLVKRKLKNSDTTRKAGSLGQTNKQSVSVLNYLSKRSVDRKKKRNSAAVSDTDIEPSDHENLSLNYQSQKEPLARWLIQLAKLQKNMHEVLRIR